jgi:hypothetical protein
LSEILPILGRVRREIIITVHGSSCEVSVNLVVFDWKLNFIGRFGKKKRTQLSEFMKILSMGA